MKASTITLITFLLYAMVPAQAFLPVILGAISAAVTGGLIYAKGVGDRATINAETEFAKSQYYYMELQKRQALIQAIQQHKQDMADAALRNDINRQDTSEQVIIQLIKQINTLRKAYNTLDGQQKYPMIPVPEVSNKVPASNVPDAKVPVSKVPIDSKVPQQPASIAQQAEQALDAAIAADPKVKEFFTKHPEKKKEALQAIIAQASKTN